MAKLIQHPSEGPHRKLGMRKVKRSPKQKKNRLEEHGQLNLFTDNSMTSQNKNNNNPTGKIVQFSTRKNPFEEALSLDEKGDERAVEFYKKAIEQEIEIADAWCNLGIIKAGSGKGIDAISCFTHALVADPRHMEAHYNLANMYLDAGNNELALTHYKLAHDINPEFTEVIFNMGLVYLNLKQYQQARESFLIYKQLVPGKQGRQADTILRGLKYL